MTLQLAIPTAPESSADWAERITRAWQQTREGVIFVGQLLLDAKAELAHGAWQSMIDRELPFTASTAQRLMKIAGDTRLANPAHAQLLPPSWATLYELTKLDDGTLNHAFTKGLIRPDMERKDAERLRTAQRREQRLARVEEIAANTVDTSKWIPGAPGELLDENMPAVKARRYPVIYADPATRFETFSEAGMEKAAENHYPTMSWDEIQALPVPSIAADDAVLFLWATVPNLLLSLRLMEAWGFDYRSHQVWLKTNEDASPHRGTGYWFINCHELLLVGVRGGMPAPLPGSQDLSLIEHAIGRHSEKPGHFRDMIDRYYPGVGKIELFARQVSPGWDAWGNEVPAQAEETPPGDAGPAKRRPIMGPGSDAVWEPNPDWKGADGEGNDDGR